MVFDKQRNKKNLFLHQEDIEYVFEIKRKFEKIDSGQLPGTDGLNSYFLKECSELCVPTSSYIFKIDSTW